MTAESAETTAKLVHPAFHPPRQSGTSSFHTARQLKTKLKRALAPVLPPKTTSSAANAAKSAKAHPRRQWSRATSVSPSCAPPSGQETDAVSPGENFLSMSSWARSSFSARKRRPLAGPSSISTSRCCVPYSTSPAIDTCESSVETTLALIDAPMSRTTVAAEGAKSIATHMTPSTTDGIQSRSQRQSLRLGRRAMASAYGPSSRRFILAPMSVFSSMPTRMSAPAPFAVVNVGSAVCDPELQPTPAWALSTFLAACAKT